MENTEKKFKLDKWRILVIVIIIIGFAVVLLYKPYYFESDPDRLKNLGIYYLSKNNYEDASAVLEKALQKESSADLLRYYALALLYKQEYKQAFEHAKKVLETDPKNADAFLIIAECYKQFGKDKLAEENYKKSIALKPTAEAYFRYGRFHYDRGHTEPAYENLTKSLDLDPEYLELYPYLAEVYTKKGLFISAFDAYEFYLNEKSKQGIPFAFHITDEADEIKKKLRLLRDMAGEA